jgi:hypothetical protein
MRENCLLDKEKKIKIPQNNKSDFIISKSNEWINSIDIEFNPKEEIDILNLFLIVKSFIKNIEFFCYKMATIIKKENEDIIITENLLMNQFMRMSYWDFENWIIDKLHIDSKYMEEDKCLYSIRLSFQKKIIEGLNKKYDEDVLKYLKPIYPWKNIILDELNIKNYIKELELEKILKKVEKNVPKEDIIKDIKLLIDKLK